MLLSRLVDGKCIRHSEGEDCWAGQVCVCPELACFAAANASAWPRGQQGRVGASCNNEKLQSGDCRPPKGCEAGGVPLPRERVDKQVAGLKGLQRVSNNNCMNAKFALFVPAR